MGLSAVFIPLGVLAAVRIGKAVRDFDRKMVAAGQQRKREAEARAAAAATTAPAEPSA